MSKLKKLFNYVHPVSFAFFALALIGGIVHLSAVISPAFADAYNNSVGSFLRMIIGIITGVVPFSLAETVLMLLIPATIVLIIVSFKISAKEAKIVCRFTLGILSVAAYLYSSFALMFAPAYRAQSLADRIGLERKDVSAEELDFTARALLAELMTLYGEVDFIYGGSSIMPYSFRDMSRLLCGAASKVDLGGLKFDTYVKPVILSVPMTYTHISGVYSFFTGEANINTNFPDYCIPFTAAHEMSHQRGIAREEEANFAAFLICRESGDIYIRYSGYMNMYEYVAGALYKANKDLYYALLKDEPEQLKDESRAYSAFFEKYRENKAAAVSGAINDTYLKSQGQKQGSKSYGMVVDLCVAMYSPKG